MTSELDPEDDMLPGTDIWGDVDDDEEPLEAASVGRSVVTDTDWTTETLLSQLRRGNIQLNPRFQRRDAWDKVRKSRFIESLILGLPIPQLVLAEDKRRRGAFIVLDGKQRLLALQQFAQGSQYGSSDDDFAQLSLSGLEVREDLRRFSLAKLDATPAKLDDLNAFLNQTVRTVVVRSWPDEAFLNLVFLRLNTGSVKLSPQELRQALHPGEFTDFIDDHTATTMPIKRALRIDRPDFRMRDVEILLRFFAFNRFLELYRGGLKSFLDGATESLNAEWQHDERGIRSLAEDFDRAIETTFTIFGKNAFFRWGGDRYERRFNRAVFDVMTYYFANPDVRGQAETRSDNVEAAFKNLCDSDPEFVRSIQTTTKTIGNTHWRLSAWGYALASAINRPDLPIPGLQDDRITRS